MDASLPDYRNPSLCIRRMIFQTPQWKWRKAYAARSYGFVDNIVYICPARGSEAEAYVEVPSEFFQLLPILFDAATLTRAAQDGLVFYVDQCDDAWVFGVELKDGEPCSVDLWHYTKSQTPPWLDLALPRKR